jgi:hypothetical protein
MNPLIKIFILLFVIAWSVLGKWIFSKHSALFGQHQDIPSETSGARSLTTAHVWALWMGIEAIGIYFLFR